MFHLAISWPEFIIRAIVVYLFLLIALRFLGKKQTSQMTPFDFVLLLIISNAVQNSMNGGDNSLVGGLLSAATLLALNYSIGWLVYKNKKIEDVVEGKAEFVIQNGKLNLDLMKRELLTLMDVEAAIRQYSCSSFEEVEWAVFENSGAITVKKKENL